MSPKLYQTFSQPPLWAFVLPFALAVMGQDACQTVTDEDGDGWAVEEGDCDDTDPAIYPGAEEVCNGIDDNCDGQVDEGLPVATYYPDKDEDGYGAPMPTQDACEQPEGFVEIPGDCDDLDPAINPDAEEVIDGRDNDCDGIADDGTDESDADGDGVTIADGDCDDSDPAINPDAVETCDSADNDCDGLIDEQLGEVWYLDADNDGSAWTT